MTTIKQAMAHGIRAHESGRFELARSVFEAIVRQAPQHPVSANAWANLSELHQTQSRFSEAAHCAFQALTIDPGHPVANVISARCSARSGDLQTAVRQLDAVPTERVSARLLFERAQLLDGLGRYERAHQDYVVANRWRTEDNPGINRNRFLRLIDDTRRCFTEDWVDGWYDVPPCEREPPLFMMGFSRSGLSLLDPVIEAHPGAEVLSGVLALEAARKSLGGRYPFGLADINEFHIDRARAAYFSVVDAHVSPGFRGLVVDKLPLNSVLLGLVYRLFPEARVVFAVRHPADVVLSNFMHAYQPNDVTVHFDSIQSSAEIYSEVMGLSQQLCSILPLRVMQIRHENLVFDYEEESLRFLRFAGLMNPSNVPGKMVFDSQVQKMSSVSTVGRWRNYTDVLEPIWNCLTPFIRAFGYTD